jgi:hypothetical protein
VRPPVFEIRHFKRLVLKGMIRIVWSAVMPAPAAGWGAAFHTAAVVTAIAPEHWRWKNLDDDRRERANLSKSDMRTHDPIGHRTWRVRPSAYDPIGLAKDGAV